MTTMMRVSNPLNEAQVLEFLQGSRYVVPGHGNAEIPAIYRTAIWHRRCEERECRDTDLAWCTKGHRSGIVMGGMAPLLLDDGDIT